MAKRLASASCTRRRGAEPDDFGRLAAKSAREQANPPAGSSGLCQELRKCPSSWASVNRRRGGGELTIQKNRADVAVVRRDERALKAL